MRVSGQGIPPFSVYNSVMHAPLPRPLRPDHRPEAASAAALTALCALVLVWRWVGFQGHDDAYYAAAALQWRHHFPALGADHWALRYPLVLPMAASLALFGQSLASLAIPTLAAYLAWLIFSYVCLRGWFGWPTAALATLGGTLIPEFPVQATYANPDILELAFVMAAFWCHQLALGRAYRTLPLLHCGVLAALAFLTRETSAALVVYFAVLCAFRPGMKRLQYGWIALSFVAVVSLEFFYFGLRTGDFFYRLHLSATHDQVDRAAQAVAAGAAGHALDSEGVLAGGPLWQLFSVLCLSQKYGLLFPLAPVAAWFALRGERMMPRERRVVADACLLAGAFILFIAAAQTKLYIVPRYFTAPAGAALIVVAAGAACLWRRAPLLSAGATCLFALLMLPLLAVENTDPLFAVHRLVALAGGQGEPIHTDPATASEAAIPLAFAGAAARMTTAPPGPGDLVALPEGAASACLASRTCGFKDRMAPFTPGPYWTLKAREAAPPPPLALLGRFFPGDIRRKLEAPNAPLMIYRVGVAPGAAPASGPAPHE